MLQSHCIPTIHLIIGEPTDTLIKRRLPYLTPIISLANFRIKIFPTTEKARPELRVRETYGTLDAYDMVALSKNLIKFILQLF